MEYTILWATPYATRERLVSLRKCEAHSSSNQTFNQYPSLLIQRCLRCIDRIGLIRWACSVGY